MRWHRRGRAQSSVTIRRAALRRALACYLAAPRQRLFWDRVTGSVALSPAMVTAPRRESVPVTVSDIPRGKVEEGPTALSSASHMSVVEPACPELNVHAQPWFPWAASLRASGSWSAGFVMSGSNATIGLLQDSPSRLRAEAEPFVVGAPMREAHCSPEESIDVVVVAGVVGEVDAGYTEVDEEICHECDESEQDGEAPAAALPTPPPRAPPIRAKQRGSLAAHARFL